MDRKGHLLYRESEMKRISKQEVICQYLERYNLRSIFDAASIAHLGIRIYNKNETVIDAGNVLDTLSIVLEGRMKVVSISADGKPSVIDHIEQFGLIGDIEYFKSSPSLHTVKVMEPTVLLDVPHRFIRSHLYAFAPFTYYLCIELVEKLTYASTSSAQRMGASKLSRMCQYLLEMADQHGSLTFPIRMMDISEKLEITDRHMRRLAAELIQKGFIEKQSRTTLTIVNRKALEDMAQS